MQTILIVEDEKRVADLLKAGLEENGYQTMVAYDGAMGLRLILFTWLYQTLSCQRWTDSSFARKSANRMKRFLF